MFFLLVLLFIVVPIVGALRDHPGRPGDRRAADDRDPDGRLDPGLDAAALAGPRARGGASTRRSPRGACPAREVLDGALVIFGGALLLTPGFITDVFGLVAAAAAHARRDAPPARAPLRQASRCAAVRRGAPGRAARGRHDVTATSRARHTRSTRGACRERRPRARGAAAGLGGEGRFSDAVTVAFGDGAADLYGVARMGLAGRRGGGAWRSSSAAASRSPCVPRAAWRWTARRRAGRRSPPPGWTPRSIEPLRRWRLQLRGRRRDRWTSSSRRSARRPSWPPTIRRPRPAAWHGYEQLCRVRGAATVGDRRSRCARWASAGTPGARRTGTASPWPARSACGWARTWPSRCRRAPRQGRRTPTSWWRRDHGGRRGRRRRRRRAGRAVGRGPAAVDHLRRRGAPAPRRPRAVGGRGRPLPGEIAGEVVCGTTLDLGRLRLDCAFFRWRGRAARASGATTSCAAPTAAEPSVARAQPVPEIELDALARELHRALAREAGQDGVQGLLLGNAVVERLLATEARGDLERLAAVLAQGGEDVDEELAVGVLVSPTSRFFERRGRSGYASRRSRCRRAPCPRR